MKNQDISNIFGKTVIPKKLGPPTIGKVMAIETLDYFMAMQVQRGNANIGISVNSWLEKYPNCKLICTVLFDTPIRPVQYNEYVNHYQQQFRPEIEDDVCDKSAFEGMYSILHKLQPAQNVNYYPIEDLQLFSEYIHEAELPNL